MYKKIKEYINTVSDTMKDVTIIFKKLDNKVSKLIDTDSEKLKLLHTAINKEITYHNLIFNHSIHILKFVNYKLNQQIK